jgi:hypothetical protein
MTTPVIVIICYVIFVGVCFKAMTVIRSRMQSQLSDAGVVSLKGIHGLPFDYQAVPMHREFYPASSLRKSLVTLWAVHVFASLALLVFILKTPSSAR